jgi:hypothetical protein
MTTIVIIDPRLKIYASAYSLSKSWHTTMHMTDGMQDAIERFIDAHPECVVNLDDIDEYLDEIENKKKDA